VGYYPDGLAWPPDKVWLLGKKCTVAKPKKGSIKMSNTIDETLNKRREASSLLSWSARLAVRVFGWQIVGEPPDVPKYVLLVAPHTSNWDFLIMLALTFAFKIKCVWMGKDSLFRGPLGSFYRQVGGIPIDRNSRSNVVEQAVQAFQRSEKMVMAIPPEGTRKRAKRWKTGFYYIALGANVPLVFGFIDFEHRTTGFGPVLMPSGDIQADMVIIRDFYKDIKGKFPENFGEVTVVAQKA
jgi:1-acyl-sn-glycerol-3-phosphate acyltransferase